MRYRKNVRKSTLQDTRPVGPVLMDATTPGYGVWWVALAGVLALVGMVLGIIYW